MSVTTVELTCAECATRFARRKSEHERSLARGATKAYCSARCVANAKRGKPIEGDCIRCAVHFVRQPNGRRERRMFCSTKCAALYRNEHRQKKACIQCGGPRHESAKRCRECRTTDDRRVYEETTLGQLRERYTTSQYHAKIRGLARSIYRGPKACARCGYDLYVEICHIRDLASFPNTATVAEVNDPSNLAALDRRCHWELDHGHLSYVVNSDGSTAWISATPASIS